LAFALFGVVALVGAGFAFRLFRAELPRHPAAAH
jgi:hypothetical protein